MVIFYVTKLAISLPALLVLGNRIVICTVKCIVIICVYCKGYHHQHPCYYYLYITGLFSLTRR